MVGSIVEIIVKRACVGFAKSKRWNEHKFAPPRPSSVNVARVEGCDHSGENNFIR